MSMRLIVGCGYLGERVAHSWLADGHRVAVTTRSPDRAKQFAAAGYEPLVCDVCARESIGRLPEVETVLYAVGFDRTAGRSMRDVYANGLANVLDALPPSTQRIIYISSTGVYGDSQGGWIDEQSPCQPDREGGRACLAAEERLGAHPLADRAIVLRLAGIYGPGRVPRREQLSAGTPLEVPAGGLLNLIHVDDAVEVVSAAAARDTIDSGKGPEIYLVSDGHPVPRREFLSEAARLWGLPPPRFVEPAEGNRAESRARGAGSKRVNNQRMLERFGVRLAYPTFREGLAAIAAAEAARPV